MHRPPTGTCACAHTTGRDRKTPRVTGIYGRRGREGWMRDEVKAAT